MVSIRQHLRCGLRALTLELEVDEKRNIINTLAASRQFSKDEEPAPPLPILAEAHTLEDGSQRLEVAFGDAARADDAPCSDPPVYEEDIGDDDADGEDPLGDSEADFGFDLARPFIESKEINGGEGVGGVDGDGHEDKEPQPDIREGRKAGRSFEIREGLLRSAYCQLLSTK
jgi:hypothetical protein